MNIGFYLLDINADNQEQQLVLKSINQLCKDRPYDNIVIFNNRFDALDMDHKYYTLHISEAKYFKGLLFVFDIRSAILTRTFPAPTKQILYVSKNTWSEKKNIPYKFWHDIYMDKNFELITDNQDMYELCDICWKTPVSNVINFQPRDIENVIQQLQ